MRALAIAPWRGLCQSVGPRRLRATPPRAARPLSLARTRPASRIRCTLSSSRTRDFPGSAVAVRALWAAQLRMLGLCAGWALRPTCSHPPLTSPRGALSPAPSLGTEQIRCTLSPAPSCSHPPRVTLTRPELLSSAPRSDRLLYRPKPGFTSPQLNRR